MSHCRYDLCYHHCHSSERRRPRCKGLSYAELRRLHRQDSASPRFERHSGCDADGEEEEGREAVSDLRMGCRGIVFLLCTLPVCGVGVDTAEEMAEEGVEEVTEVGDGVSGEKIETDEGA